MKKMIMIILCVFILSGCHQETNISLEDYHQFVNALDQQTQFQETSDFYDITLIVNQIDEQQFRYDVIIDNVQEELINVKAISKDNSGSNAYYPSLGIYDDEMVILDSYTAKDEHRYKGINLSGITSVNPVEVSVLVEFEDQHGKVHQEYFKLEGKAA